VPLKIDKKNADVKAPPKSPFTLQLALKSSIDVYYFSVPCELHSLIGRELNQKLSKDEFKKFWESLGPDKTYSMEFGGASQLKLYQGLDSLPDDITTYLENNGFSQMAKTTKQQTGQTMIYFSAKTVNGLPLLLEVAHPHNGVDKSVSVSYKIPVAPLKPLLEGAIKHIFGEKN
jgi:hypothetical protein